MTSYLHRINTNTPGPRDDVTPLFADYDALTQLVQDLAQPFNDLEIEYVAGIDALGFILGTALALYFKVGFIAIRKGGKLPVETDQVHFVDYSGQQKALELPTNALKPGERVLLADEWIETGTQLGAALELIEGQGGIVAGIAAINIDDNENTQKLRQKYQCHSVMEEGRN